MAQAVQGDNSRLIWTDVEPAKQNGRAQLFIGTYFAFRNRRAHRELRQHANEALQEFLLLNHLVVLEKASQSTDLRCQLIESVASIEEIKKT
jgi:hypothetical protein